MDRSVDSIGSCSLDVDADSTDVSDTSGSLNFPTPMSVKDITREFTSNIRDRCTLFENNKGHKVSELSMVLQQPSGTANSPVNPASGITNVNLSDFSPEKKPSYLNLACCVNGYSNLTTYDSKIRQDINKSREVSPIRPSTNSIQYCKKNNSLAPPILHTMVKENESNKRESFNNQCKFTGYYNNQENDSINHVEESDSQSKDESRNTSFIQQRVERLYGPAALAHGFYSPRKVRSSCNTQEIEQGDISTSELTRKFQELTPSKDYSEFRRKLNATTSPSNRQVPFTADTSNITNNSIDLPVLRHLSREFRAQLPIVSPKKNNLRVTSEDVKNLTVVDEVDRKISLKPVEELTETHNQVPNGGVTQIIDLAKPAITNEKSEGSVEKNGLFFLDLLRSEQNRLLALANKAEIYLETLSKNPDISEDVLGLLRSASGKARLLVSQKMKQFEGLCRNNLKSSPEDKFPTTSDDLQGFWDMVNLQVDHIDLIFSEIEILKKNNWKKAEDGTEGNNGSKPQFKANKTVNQKIKVETPKNKETRNSSASAQKRESQRKMLQEMKRKNKMALNAKSTTSDPMIIESKPENPSTVEIFIGNSSVSK